MAINQSLSCLAKCIHALADSSTTAAAAKTAARTAPPYRDSVLTKLLMNALGGNSRTIMVTFSVKIPNGLDHGGFPFTWLHRQ